VRELERLAPGVYRIAAGEPAGNARDAALDRGWRYVELRGEKIDSKDAFLRACKEAFRLPSWFGGNWDALADSLCDLSWLEPAPGTLVTFTSAGRLADADPQSFATAIEIFRAACDWWEPRGMRLVVLVGGAPRTYRLRRPGQSRNQAPG